MSEDSEKTVHVFIEDTAGQRFECDIPVDMPYSTVAADFFEARGWPTRDAMGKGQRAVIELVDPKNPNRTKRLRSEQTAAKHGLTNGALLRIFPEAIAGVVDQKERIRALVTDQREMEELMGWNTHISFRTNTEHAPTIYTICFDYTSFRGLREDGHTPILTNNHRFKVTLGADYPQVAPSVQWETPIFHPNINPETGEVCLGVLREKYLPGLGLARVVSILSEMVQYRNYDMIDSLNAAAAAWTEEPDHWHFISEIGGSPFQGPVHEIVKQLEDDFQGETSREKLTFKPMTGLKPKGE